MQSTEDTAAAGRNNFINLSCQVHTNTRQSSQIFFLLRQQTYLMGQIAQNTGSITIRADTERVCPLDFQKISYLFEYDSKVGVVYWHDTTPQNFKFFLDSERNNPLK